MLRGLRALLPPQAGQLGLPPAGFADPLRLLPQLLLRSRLTRLVLRAGSSTPRPKQGHQGGRRGGQEELKGHCEAISTCKVLSGNLLWQFPQKPLTDGKGGDQAGGNRTAAYPKKLWKGIQQQPAAEALVLPAVTEGTAGGGRRSPPPSAG